MRRWLMGIALAGAVLAMNDPVMAQDDRYDDEDEYGDRNYAFAVGAGLVEPGEEVETYLMASFRIRVGDRGGNGDDDWRGRREGGIEGYIEPEIGYWEASESGRDGSDLLVGANIIGVVPFGNVDSFFGAGAGVHFIDAQLVDEDPRADGSETKLGLNAQFGLDLHISEAWSVFGAGRFDLVQGAADNLQAKVYLGLRAAF